MSTCSTATSAHGDLRRRLFHDADVDDDAASGRRLETRMRDLERDWHAYKASRRSHRRSRSATPSSAVTSAGGPVDGDGLAAGFLRCLPRRPVCSLQHQDDRSDDADSAGAVKRVDSGGRRHGNGEGNASSVSSVEVACPASSEDSSCSCPPNRAALRRSYSSSSSSCSVATESSLSPPARAGVVVDTDEHSTNTEEGRLVTGYNSRVRWFAAIALVVVAGVVVAMMAVVVELGMDEEEFLVPT